MGVFQWNFIFVGLKRYLESNCDIILNYNLNERGIRDDFRRI